jgi:hypothetical protein
MEEHLTAMEAPRAASEPLVRHVTQAHPNNLVDPWWMDKVLSLDYAEFLYRQWIVDLDEMQPETLERRETGVNDVSRHHSPSVGGGGFEPP